MPQRVKLVDGDDEMDAVGLGLTCQIDELVHDASDVVGRLAEGLLELQEVVDSDQHGRQGLLRVLMLYL